MWKITQDLFEFLLIAFIFNLNGVDMTELWETSLANRREEFKYQSKTYVKVYDLKIEELKNDITD